MSESFSFAEEAPAAAEESSRDRRLLALGGGVAAAVVLVAGGWFLLHDGGDQSVAFAPAPRSVRPALVASAAPKPLVTLPPSTDVQLGRNPFKALYVAPAAPVAGTSANGTAANGTAANGPQPVTSSAPLAARPTTSSAGAGTAAAPVFPAAPAAAPTAPTDRTYPLRLLAVDVRGQKATFQLDGSKATATVGKVFGALNELQLLQVGQDALTGQPMATVQLGESRFDAPLGKTLYVR